jgi:hypothetical protein
MKRMGVIFAIISVFPLFLSRCFAVQTSDSNSFALKGIKALFVLVEDLPQKATGIGLTTERIKTATELKLRGEGISVPNYSYEDPYLHISINVVYQAFSVEVSLRENVVLKRDKSINCRAATWLNSVTGVHSNDPNYIIAGLQAVLDSFLNDYYKANPKKKR